MAALRRHLGLPPTHALGAGRPGDRGLRGQPRDELLSRNESRVSFDPMRSLRDHPESDRLFALLSQWGGIWGLPRIEERLEIRFSPRFRSSLGRCAPASGEIRLAAFLCDGPSDLLQEALCHEAAHAAVHELHGRAAKPHGTEWRELMRAAGFEPRARIPARLLEGVAPRRRQAQGGWLHRCPVCQVSRVARRPVHRWRCAACRNDGLDGRLLVTRVSADGVVQQ